MLDGKMVRIRFRKDQPEQPLWVFVGKILHFSADWFSVLGKGVLIFRRETLPEERRTFKGQHMVSEPARKGGMVPVQVDEEARTLVFPREVVANIRLLPDDFDLDSIEVKQEGHNIELVVNGAPDSSLEVGAVD